MWWLHISTVCCAFNEDGRKLICDVLRDAQGMPGIDGAIGKDNVGIVGGETIVIVRFLYCLKDC